MFKPKLSSILSDLTKKIQQLQTLVETNSTQIEANDVKVQNLMIENNDLQDENIRALRVRDNLNNLLA